MENVSLYNGNEKRYTKPLPKLVYLTKYINEVALKHIEKNTGLKFIKNCWGYETQPKTSKQIVKLFLTYNFKTEYHNNATTKNTIFLKSMHNVGFKINAICFNCCKDNYISTNGMNKKDKLMC